MSIIIKSGNSTNTANVDASGNLQVTLAAGALSLPTGASTAANQATEITQLTAINTNTANIPAKGQATMANSTPVVIASNQSSIPVTIPPGNLTSYIAGPTNVVANVSPYNSLNVSVEPSSVFQEDFDGTILDASQWLPSVVSGGGSFSIANARATFATGISSSAYSYISSIPNFESMGLSFGIIKFHIQLEAASITNTHRFWGIGTIPVSFTTTTPLQNALGFEIDPTGALNAVVYSNGTKTFSTALTRPSDGLMHNYTIQYRTDAVYWFIDSNTTSAASGTFILPNIFTLPVHLHLINGATPPASSPIFISDGISVSDSAHNNNTISDGTYPWRKAKIDGNGNFSMVYGDGGNIDAFGRLRVSEPTLLFESIQKYDKQPLLWDESVAGGGTSTFIANESCVNMAVGTVAGDQVVRQTKRYIQYTPGRSKLIYTTGNLGGIKAGVTQRIGTFDTQNGLFFVLDGTNLGVAQRSFTSGVAVDTVVTQANWNLDRLDGTGPSRFTLDTTKANIFVFDIEWLGVGRTRFGFVINGQIIYVHAFNNANALNTVYMTTAKLPIRYEITNTGTPATATTMKHICTAVMAEGGAPTGGIVRSVDMGTTFKTAGAATRVPLLSIQLQSGFIQASLQPLNYQVMTSSAVNWKYELVLNGTLTGAVFGAVAGYAQVDTTATAIAGGTILDSGYIASTNRNITGIDLSGILTWVGTNLAGASDTISIVITAFTATTAVAQFNYREIV